MKRNLILILTLMPFLALGQSNFYNNIFGDRFLTTEYGFEKNLILRTSNDLERHLETTLINDIKYYKPVLNLDLDKSYGLSLTIKTDRIINIIDDHELDEMLFKVRPLKNYKWQFRKPIYTKSLYEN
jgi:hypothetical protein